MLGRKGTVMPEAGSIVTCRVLSVNPNQATVSIICVGPNKMHSPVSGTVKKQNVRAHMIDTVSIYNISCYTQIVKWWTYFYSKPYLTKPNKVWYQKLLCHLCCKTSLVEAD